MSESSNNQGGFPSLPEDVQLVLSIGGARLQQGGPELVAAALVELALLGRVGSVPETGFLARKDVRRLTVLNDRPTGVRPLDAALTALSDHGKPWAAYSCVKKLMQPVARETQDALLRRGAIARDGKFGGLKTTLTISDEQQHRDALQRLDKAWLGLEQVTDARSGAFIDLMRNAGERFSRGAQHEPVVRGNWYPDGVRETVAAILEAERIAASASSGTGYEG